MTAKFFVDTNLLVYAYDRSEPIKQRRALDVLNRLALSSAGAVSTQVLGEFFVTVVRKTSVALSVAEAYSRLEYYCRFWTVIGVSATVVLEAGRGVRDYQFNFWDAQIWAAA